MTGQPPDDAYGRVTAPERFRLLHEAGDRLVNELEQRFVVERVEGPEVDTELASRYPERLRVVCLTPTLPTAATITVMWTGFPGLHLRLGRWHVEAFPRCGCDACDEDPTGLVGEIRQMVEAVVQSGFTEWFDGRRLGFELSHPDGRRSSGEVVVGDERRRVLGKPGRYRWEAWPPRDRTCA